MDAHSAGSGGGGGGEPAEQYASMEAAEHVAVTPGIPPEQIKQSPMDAFRAFAQRSARQPAQLLMTSRITPWTMRLVASQGPANTPSPERRSRASSATRSTMLHCPL